MSEMYLRQPRFTYSACEPFIKNKERILKFKETGDSWYSYQNELDKACFKRDIAYGDFKYLTRRRDSDKILRNKAFNIAKNSKHDGYHGRLASTVYEFFDKNTSGSIIKKKNISNKKLTEELHKPIIREFNKRKVHSSFIDNIWGGRSCWYAINKQIIFYYVLLIFSLNAHGLFLWKI